MPMDETLLPSIEEGARQRFEAAWRAGRPEPIEALLPPENDPRHLATLEELICIELEFWWKLWGRTGPGEAAANSPALVEGYLERFPALRRPAVLLRLLRQEYLARHLH